MSVCFSVYTVRHYLLWWNDSVGILLTGTQDHCCVARWVFWSFTFVHANTFFVGSQFTSFMDVSLKSLRCETWLAVECGLVNWTDFRVCITTRMWYFYSYLFRVLDTTPVYFCQVNRSSLFIFPYHIPDKRVGMFSSSDHLKKHLMVIWNAFTDKTHRISRVSTSLQLWKAQTRHNHYIGKWAKNGEKAICSCEDAIHFFCIGETLE